VAKQHQYSLSTITKEKQIYMENRKARKKISQGYTLKKLHVDVSSLFKQRD